MPVARVLFALLIAALGLAVSSCAGARVTFYAAGCASAATSSILMFGNGTCTVLGGGKYGRLFCGDVSSSSQWSFEEWDSPCPDRRALVLATGGNATFCAHTRESAMEIRVDCGDNGGGGGDDDGGPSQPMWVWPLVGVVASILVVGGAMYAVQRRYGSHVWTRCLCCVDTREGSLYTAISEDGPQVVELI
eukprot:Opistho-1_new@31653